MPAISTTISVARDAANEIVSREAELAGDELDRLFHRLAAEWRRDTAHISFISRRAQHPAYQRIIALGMPVVPLILREFERKSDQWTWALTEITREDPVPPTCYYAEARQAWLDWGRQNGYLSNGPANLATSKTFPTLPWMPC